MSSIRRVERQTAKDQAKDHRKLPVGRVVSAPVKGEFLAIPLVGWIARRAQVKTPLAMIAAVLLDEEKNEVRGSLRIEMPVLPETELATLGALERFGWDGRVWPGDDGWPTGSGKDEENLRALIKQANLRASLAFPPGDKGASAQKVHVSRAQGDFLMPPLPEPTVPVDEGRLERLRALCEDPSVFFLQEK